MPVFDAIKFKKVNRFQLTGGCFVLHVSVGLLRVGVDGLGGRASAELVRLAVDQVQALVQTNLDLGEKQFALIGVLKLTLVSDALDA